ncbi:MAG TPA: hypothetical protein DCZ91_02965, partial [Lachnospiraceae bacterium]|nr:hypothetical protein [Lachnospiraceae bacterium]
VNIRSTYSNYGYYDWAASGQEKSWGNRFWVVTAYDAKEVEANTTVKNDFTVKLHPVDGKDEDVIVEATPSTWSYKNYDWIYEGDIIGVTKKNGWNSANDNIEYTGWLEAYKRAKAKGEDYGEIPFTVTGRMKGYEITHHVQGADLGAYKEGTYYTLTTVDDFIYMYNGKGGENEHLLGADDYYFSSVTINQTDYGYDIYEDKEIVSERQALINAGKLQNFDSSVKVYAMYGKAADKTTKNENPTWELAAGDVMMDETGKASYVFDENQIAREPFRVKVEHDSIDYRTVCEIKLAVRIKAGSDAMQQIVNARNEGAEYEVSPQIQFENISGVIGTGHNADGSTTVFRHKEQAAGEETEGEGSGEGNPDGEDSNEENTQNTHEGKAEPNGFNYDGRNELKTQTQNLYENNLLVRDSASRTVTWLNMTSQANKKYTSNNDAKNNRVLVDYYLTAYDGYEIYDRSCLDYLKKSDQELISPGRKHVVFYDLLPYGMQFDASTPVTAGRIKELDSKGNYMTKTRSWDSTQVTVTVDPDKDIIQNYKGTGRTMVAFHIAYSGGDSASYTSGKWIEGWGVSFRAYYEWKNMESINKVDANANLCAFMPDFNEGYVDAINRSNPMLYGLRDSVYADNGEIADAGKAAVYKDLLEGKTGAGGWRGNIDGNEAYDKYTVKENDVEVEKWYRNVLYAEEKLNDYVSTSSESDIKKLVRADEDQFGTFRESTTVSEGGTYTYETTVSADENDIQGIVIFDRLENAKVDRANPTDGKADPFSPFENADWTGKFLAVDLSALEKQDITGTKVYYNESRNAAVPVEGESPYDVLSNTEKGWYEQSAFESEMQQKYGENYTKWTDYVQAVAVSFKPDYVLPKDSSASFRIQMEVPDGTTSGGYAYNSVSFSSYTKGQEDTRSIVSSNSVRVGVSPTEKLEIVKRTAGVVPEAFKDATFTFRLHEKYTTGGKPQYLAFQAYDLYKEERDGTWTKQEGELHATDENGYLYLKAGEKAVFTIADTDRVVVEEKSNVFWESNPAPGETVNEDGEFVNEVVTGNTHVRTWTNTYRPVLYAQKRLLAVPEDVNLTDADKTFTFKLWVKKNGEYQPLANAEFWYVDGVPADGGIPIRVNRDGEVWTEKNSVADTKRTGADGTFSIREGQTIALFPGTVGTEYKLTEENMDADGYGLAGNAIWYCPVMAETAEGAETGVTDTVRIEGNSESITNYYRWKDLYITKKITHQDPAECTRKFTFRITELKLDENGELAKDAQGNVIEVKKTNAEGQEVQVTEGLTWELLDAQVQETTGETEGTSGEGSPTSGTLNGNGEFICALAGKTVKISGLEAGKYYVVKETAIETEADGTVLYRPVNDTAEFKMPAYSVKKEVTITNDYLKRPLSLTKTVSGDNKPEADAAPFEFTIKVNGQLLPAGISYTIKEQGNVIETGTTDGTGIFHLRDGQTVIFKDAGMLGDSFEITEIPYDEYTQTYPVNGTTPVPATGTLSGEGGEAPFVNGPANALRISKEYVAKAGDVTAGSTVETWRSKFHPWKDDGAIINSYSGEDAAEFILEVTDESGTYIWPKAERGRAYVIGTNQQTGKESTFEWQNGKSIKLPPWFTLSIEFGNGGNQIPQNATYTLTEVESSRKRIIKSGDNYLQISQKYPANEGSITGVAASAPNATIINEISTLPNFEGSRIGKRMTSASSEVPTGQELVWRLEECQNGTWSPKEGIEYAVFDEEGTPISNEMKKTETDGKVILTKTEGHWPEVWFKDATVYINPSNMLTSNGTLRLVEVPQESGSGWGMLVGYGTSAGGSYSWDGGNDVGAGEARVFYNSNKKASIKIEKYMETRSYQEFTMILKQVVAIDGSASEIDKDNYGVKILKSESREGVPYTIHNTDGTEVTGNKSGTTGAGGEIRLKAGQYVILDVPDGTVWTVAEDVYTTQNYRLTDLAPEIKTPGGKLTWLDDNLMLINLPAAVRYMLVYDGNGKGVTDVPAPMTIEADSTDESATFTIASMIPKKGGYLFKGWATDRNAEASTALLKY